MKRLLLGFLTVFCTHLDAAQDWLWVRLLDKKGRVCLHLSRKALSSKNQARTALTLKLSSEDMNDLINGRVPTGYINCSIEYGSEFPPDDESSNYAPEDSLSDA